MPQDLEDEEVSQLCSTKVVRNPGILTHFDFCRVEDTNFPSRRVSESSLPGFCNFMESFLDTCHTAGMDVMRFLEKSLELTRGEFLN